MYRTKAACAAVAALVALAVSSCAADPGPPPLVQQEELAEHDAANNPAPERKERTQIQVGAEPLRDGLNPHLLADDTSTVQAIADLTLPSAFVGGVRDPNLLRGATVRATSPGAMTVRYVIAPEAQWSDGTPITGADFAYLWRGMSSTPGAIAPAGYRAISNVRVSGPAGKTVDVDFSAPVHDWRALFNHLLPAHLLAPDASDFATAASDTLPASAGRFMVNSVDRGRGTIVLNRNDRFWGADPARVDILTVNAARSTTQIADRLRAGQLAFVDTVPEETTKDVFDLIPGIDVRSVDGPRTLGVTLSATSPLLGDRAAREELRSLIDVPLVARLAAGRSSELLVAQHEPPALPDPVVLPQRVTESRPLRVAADAADPAASAAARSLVDLLEQRGVSARVVSTDTASILSQGLPSGTVDVMVHWDPGAGSAAELASRVQCPAGEYRAGNLSGICYPQLNALSADILAGRVSGDAARAGVDTALEAEAVWVPLLHERRVQARGGGIVAEEPDLTAAAAWQVDESQEQGEQ